MKNISFFIVSILVLTGFQVYSQDALPVNQDYLLDNIYLIHPAAAGIGETGKIRIAVRMDELGIADTPQIQTANIHGKIGEFSKAGFGLILVNNESNTGFAQTAIKGTYAYHLDLNKTTRFSQLSFGVSIAGIQSEVGGQSFFSETNVIPVVQPIFNVSADIGVSYHLSGFSSYFTVKNAFSNNKESLSFAEELNVKNYILGLAYFFGDEKRTQYEPSLLLQYKKETGEQVVDLNFKVYKTLQSAQVWAVFSYRKSFGSVFSNDRKFISPMVGISFNKMMFSYAFTKQIDDIIVSSGTFHQITLGFNILFRELKLAGNPNINGTLF